MTFHSFDLMLFLVSVTIVGFYVPAGAVCHECQDNKVACVNQTSYHLCYSENVPNTEQLFTCPDGMVCTNLPNICFQRNLLPASCGDTSSCGICNSNQVFACTSRTTFAFCFGAPIPSDTVGTCPVGTTCDSSSPNFCVEELEATSIVCNLEEPIKISYLYSSLYEGRVRD